MRRGSEQEEGNEKKLTIIYNFSTDQSSFKNNFNFDDAVDNDKSFHLIIYRFHL